MSQFRECGKRTSEKPSPKTFGLGFTLQFNGWGENYILIVWSNVFKHQVSLKFCDRQCKLKFVSFKLINMKKFNQNHVVPKIRDKKTEKKLNDIGHLTEKKPSDLFNFLLIKISHFFHPFFARIQNNEPKFEWLPVQSLRIVSFWLKSL